VFLNTGTLGVVGAGCGKDYGSLIVRCGQLAGVLLQTGVVAALLSTGTLGVVTARCGRTEVPDGGTLGADRWAPVGLD